MEETNLAQIDVNGRLEGVLPFCWVCGAKEMTRKLGIINDKRRKNFKINMGRN
jgi:hypothetical protein